MTWADKDFLQNQRWHEFSFFATGGADGLITESVVPGTDFADVAWKLKSIRVHLSVAFASVEDLTVRLSAANGSAYDLMLLSQAMNGISDLLWQLDIPETFGSADDLVINLSLVSATNIIGITVNGWAAIG